MALLVFASLILITIEITLALRRPDPKHEFVVGLYMQISEATDSQDATAEQSKSSIAA